MRTLAAFAVAAFALGANGCEANASDKANAVIDHEVRDIDGNTVKLSSYRSKVLLVVNVASECGFTPQYAELEQLYERYRERGVVVLGFPSNDFGEQEPGTAADIKKFTSETYGVTFPLFEKVHAKGDGIAPLYKTLTTDTPFPGTIGWNFTKFVVDKTGHVVARFPSKVTPLSPELTAAIDKALAG